MLRPIYSKRDMRRIIGLILIVIVLGLCATTAYEAWRDIRYDREIPHYLRICMQQAGQSLVKDRGESPSQQNPSRTLVPTENPFTARKTKLRMTSLALSIGSYAHDNAHLPESIGMLGLNEKELLDAWSNNFVYVRESDKTFILCSPGSNGVLDGERVNGEIAGRYSLEVLEKQLKGNAGFLRHAENRGYLGETR